MTTQLTPEEALLRSIFVGPPDLSRDQLLQVQDDDGIWHAAAVGPGLLCDLASGQVGCHTVVWDHGIDQVNCSSCRARLHQLETVA